MSDIDTAAADSLKVLDPERPIREADMTGLAAGTTGSRMTQNDHPIIQTRNSSMGLDHFSIVLIEPGDRGP